MTFEQLKARVAADGVSDTEAGVLVNQAYQALVVRAKFLQKSITLGTTVAEQAVYDFPESDLVQIESVWIGTVCYDRVGLEELREVVAGRGRIEDPRRGIVSPYFDSTGNPQFRLYPVPGESGETIDGIVVDTPAELTAGQSPVTPVDFDQAIIDGARARIYDEEDEDGGNRERLDAKFDSEVRRLEGRKHTRIGRGPQQARIHNIHI